MVYKPKKKRNDRLSEERKKLFQILMFPFVVIVLIVIIMIADHRRERQNEESFAETEPVQEYPTETMNLWDSGERLPEVPGDEQPDETEPPETESEEEPVEQDPFATDDFQRDGVPEILELMKVYLQARALADAEAMNRAYGITDASAAELEAQRARMSNYSKYVQDFENVATYVMEGPDADTWLVYTVADINFYSSKTRAPMSLWCYVRKDGEGNYLLVDNSRFSPQQLEFAEEANHSQEVRKLAADVNTRLAEALMSDERLRVIYGVLQAGSPVWDGTRETEPEVAIEGENSGVSVEE